MLSVGRHPTASITPRFVKTVTLPLLYGLALQGSGLFSRVCKVVEPALQAVGNALPKPGNHVEFTFTSPRFR